MDPFSSQDIPICSWCVFVPNQARQFQCVVRSRSGIFGLNGDAKINNSIHWRMLIRSCAKNSKSGPWDPVSKLKSKFLRTLHSKIRTFHEPQDLSKPGSKNYKLAGRIGDIADRQDDRSSPLFRCSRSPKILRLRLPSKSPDVAPFLTVSNRQIPMRCRKKIGVLGFKRIQSSSKPGCSAYIR